MWKAVKDPVISFSLFSGGVGLLNDFQGATTKVFSIFPALQAILPILILMATVYFGLHAVIHAFTTVPSACYAFVHSRRPGVKWGNQQAEIIHQCALECERLFYKEITKPGTYVELKRLAQQLSIYQIPCPPVHNNITCIGEWALFLSDLSGYADTYNLKAARQLWEKTRPKTRRDNTEG